MSVLRSLENRIAGLVEGTFGRVFRSEVRPVELARGLAKEMDQHKTVSVSRVYVPNEYVVWLGAEDRQRFEGVEGDIADELAGYLLEHARREKLALVSRPKVSFSTDDNLRLGEFGIQARLVRASEQAGHEPQQGDHGHTMVYSTSDRLREELDRPRQPDNIPATRAMVLAEGKRMVVPASGAVIGRSRDADIVLSDPNVSRRHAEIRPAGRGRWTVNDMGSTNGVKVNGSLISGDHPLQAGDRIALGTADIRFVVE
ncbi:MAG: Adenylate cyclase [uncultured Solirubrobacteraceae bacterium]|uniref:Adenylate cyclase n=1 Tax=uncultured Solirubrobacteraceae bacterium TaxID=1162706 RepID=A0A6J4SA41_9ACTN|nr:MAG: Adenylate cyclase [uncultured Solirubrobacteraceae bacterium]